MGCIEIGASSLPDKMMDTSTLSLAIDNQGMATLQVVMLTKSSTPITTFDYTFSFNGGSFGGFIDSDVQRRLEGTDYWEHAIVAKGMMCGGGGSSSAPTG